MMITVHRAAIEMNSPTKIAKDIFGQRTSFDSSSTVMFSEGLISKTPHPKENTIHVARKVISSSAFRYARHDQSRSSRSVLLSLGASLLAGAARKPDERGKLKP